ncbi:membrane associated rhomboid family serine protease [Flavobacterium sp. 9]|uniref:rhomboid family intramembrane serine protease n=1 Tax=Flavobacterium sp. 9 TaxID=2035198 RepID=UPI000C19DA2F|nr:rhomboid family intramembrane serine protease [Flavobacterium sp. 9]PIF30092.1 membrane associated rhomboid family serine protease [Flavobacterium sp. 9]
MINITPTVKQLLIINSLFYIGSTIVGEPAYKFLSLCFFENRDFYFWQIITHMFMHAPIPNIMHIIFNMLALYFFGSALEHFWGSKRFILFYISCGLGAAFLYIAMNYYYYENGINILVRNGFSKNEILKTIWEGKMNVKWREILTPTDFQAFKDAAYSGNFLGSSGVVYGLMVGFACMVPNQELTFSASIPIPIKVKYYVSGLLLVDLYWGVSGDSIFSPTGIDSFANLGGAITGMLMMLYWKDNKFKHNRWN